jgi:predicted nucleic-acid-binding protein
LGSQSSNGNNGNGKYDIDQIIHTLQKEGKVYVPPQFLHEIVRELRKRGFSVSYWTTTGLIELAGEDDEIPF